jgi:4-alpha-glucanotransferase
VELPRTAGVQLHPTSLPSGRLGPDAYAWIDWLAAAGQTWWQMLPLGPPDRYGSPYKSRSAFAAWRGLLAEPKAPVTRAEALDFRERAGGWIEDWIAYGGRGALIDQVRFAREWAALRAYAGERGVRLIGDIPIYVAPRSADQRAHPEIFQAGAVAGVPPDAFTDKGQLWGNPLYDWHALRRESFGWWIDRFARTFELFDMARVDHFRGFASYWAVPAGARDARGGTWRRGPGRALFDAVSARLGPLALIAEDLGVITPPVERLRDELGLPGMVVLQFGFTPSEPHSPHILANHVEHRVVYTGTHDHDTVGGWYRSLEPPVRALVDDAIDRGGVRETEIHWSLIRLAYSSVARIAMIQLQDVLGLGSEGRMNRPGTAAGAWKWRLDAIPARDLALRLRAATEAAAREAIPTASSSTA